MRMMSKSVVLAGVVLVAGAVLAAEGDQEKKDQGERRGPPPAMQGARPPREGMGPGGGMMGALNGANWLGRFLENGETLDKLGLDGDARAKLVKELGEISSRLKEIQEKIRQTSMEQGRLARETMEKPGADFAPVLEKVKQLGDLRTEQAILSTKVLAVVRDNLTKEQRDQVRELMMKEGRSRLEARREFNGNMERRRPQFEGRRRNRGPAGERPPRPAEDK